MIQFDDQETSYGLLRMGKRETIYAYLRELLEERAMQAKPFSVGLTGGSTPKAFYEWTAQHGGLSVAVRQLAIWGTSDERMVPLDDPESNFGNADRMLLQSSVVPDSQKIPWPISSTIEAVEVAARFEAEWTRRFDDIRAFDLCFLGMGDDGHTASLFPGSPLLKDSPEERFAAVEVPGKGWRLTITPSGLQACDRIYVAVTGEGKAEMLKSVMSEPSGTYPIQVLEGVNDRVTWLVDEAAAKHLS